MPSLFFTCYGDPVPKQRPRVVAGHTYTPAKTLAWEKEVGMAALLAMSEQQIAIIDQPIAVDMVFCRKGYIRVDLDNLVKAVLDGLNQVVFTDDYLICSLSASRVLGAGDLAKVYVSIKTLDDVSLQKPKRGKRA